MSEPSPAVERFAKQLRELMDRHQIPDAPSLSRRIEASGIGSVDPATLHRWLTKKVKTEPYRQTLRMVAESLGEKLDEAFPEPLKGSPGDVAVKVDERVIFVALKAADGRPLTQDEMERALRIAASIEKAEATHKAKQSRRK